ncbi:MAG TPA: ATP-binding protein [Candidatus Deferrimicrobium sp.]|nr:ATP-binding protein [Candidatus Kapabacteria bacterium]HLP58248.1 ATP-binding protein [Candidatus Deferrimicrobium sp.]
MSSINSLKEIIIKNFRGFKDHKIPLKKISIIVGKNNVGKTTIVEAIRLIALITDRYQNAFYKSPPSWLGRGYIGISPSFKNIGINLKSIFHQYGDPPSIIKAIFDDNSTIEIYLGEESQLHAVIKNPDGNIIKNRKQAGKINLNTIKVLPQVYPVQKKEKILIEDYVKENLNSSLSSSHFRNQLYYFKEFNELFKDTVEDTWEGVSVDPIQAIDDENETHLHLFVRNENFVAEISEMGHGLQIWLQIIWFLTRIRKESTVILDEPDVYLHADLQRKLIRFLKSKYPQIIITTHSLEIISEVEPNEILIVNNTISASTYADTLPVVQNLVKNIGSVQNVQLIKLWNTRRLILVEGKDINFLKYFHDILFPDSKENFNSIPNMSLNGWGGWNYGIGSNMFLKNSLNEKIITYCIFDRDYHSDEEISKRYREAKERDIHLHIWNYKEIENYLLIPETILRVIEKNKKNDGNLPNKNQIIDKINSLTSDMEDSILDNISSALQESNRSLNPKRTNQDARKKIKNVKDNTGGILPLVSGKSLIKNLSQWTSKEFNVSLDAISILKEMQIVEIEDEVKKVISAIEKNESFEPWNN